MQLLCVHGKQLGCHTRLGMYLMQLFCIHGIQLQVVVNLCVVVDGRCKCIEL